MLAYKRIRNLKINMLFKLVFFIRLIFMLILSNIKKNAQYLTNHNYTNSIANDKVHATFFDSPWNQYFFFLFCPTKQGYLPLRNWLRQDRDLGFLLYGRK